MKELQKATLLAIRDEMAGRAWSDNELAELVVQRHGAISGLQELLWNLDALRGIDLGATPPADSVGREPEGDG